MKWVSFVHIDNAFSSA